MSPLLFALAFAIVVLGVYMGRYSGRVRAEASRFIAAPPEAVYAGVADLQRWQAWNPWLEHARDARPDIDGVTLTWNVPEVGRGSVRQVMQHPGSELRQQFDFALPFACRGRSDWQFEPAPGGTRVTWRFKGRVAFTLRAFAATVQGATGLDLRFGLDRLASTLEGSAPAYTLDYAGEQQQPAARFAQLLHRGSLDRLAADLPGCVDQARRLMAAAGCAADGEAVVHYLKTQLKLRTVDCRVGLPLAEGADAPAGLTRHDLPAHTAYVVHFEGPPEALELAWYQAMQRLRVEQRQPHPQWPPSARYLTPSAPDTPGRVTLMLPLRD